MPVDNGRLVHHWLPLKCWDVALKPPETIRTVDHLPGGLLEIRHNFPRKIELKKWLPVYFCCIFQSHLESSIWVQGSHSQCPALRSCYAWGVHPGTIMQVWICFCSSFFGLILQVHVKFFHWSMDPFKSNHGLENHVPFFQLWCRVIFGVHGEFFGESTWSISPTWHVFFVQAEKSSLRTFHDYSEIVCTHGDDLICWVHNPLNLMDLHFWIYHMCCFLMKVGWSAYCGVPSSKSNIAVEIFQWLIFHCCDYWPECRQRTTRLIEKCSRC